MFDRDTTLKTLNLGDLIPTQMAVGYRQVQAKRRRWHVMRETGQSAPFERMMIPVVHGPDDRFYVIDRHHLARALREEGIRGVLTSVLADFRDMRPDDFWQAMHGRGWCRPYDEHGRRRDYSDMPQDLMALRDDPFRSLAGELRRLGAYAKNATPFSEFIWADFFRQRLPAADLDVDFGNALHRALDLAKSTEAAHLPGWRDRHPDARASETARSVFLPEPALPET